MGHIQTYGSQFWNKLKIKDRTQPAIRQRWGDYLKDKDPEGKDGQHLDLGHVMELYSFGACMSWILSLLP